LLNNKQFFENSIHLFFTLKTHSTPKKNFKRVNAAKQSTQVKLSFLEMASLIMKYYQLMLAIYLGKMLTKIAFENLF